MKVLSLLLLLLFFFFSLSLSSPLINPDLLGLLAFKSSFPTPPPPPLSSWSLSSPSPCNFSHIQCHPRSHHLISLSLPSLNLSSKLAFRGILNLHSLSYLNLSHNHFTGSIHPNLTHLHSLAYIDLSHNALNGTIPFGLFAQCRSLKVVSFANNELYGHVPWSIASCGSLTSLNLSSNRLSGSVPNGILMLKGLESLDLGNNAISGSIPFEFFAQCRSLKVLSLANNELYGYIPKSIGSCWGIESLNLSSNRLSGPIPNEILLLKGLKSLDLGNNLLVGVIPVGIGSLLGLESLRLDGNLLVGELPESVKWCRSLKEVDFSHNFLVGSFPSWVFELGLEKFSISGNELNGRIELPTFGVGSLLELDLSANEFEGEIAMEVGSLWRLERLNLSRNRFSGRIPGSLGEMKVLQVVDLSGNTLTGGIPVEIGNCISLTSLILAQNNLTGSIPLSLTTLTNLENVDLSLNSLTGSLPANLSNLLPHLLSFNISHNQFEGPIPSGHFFDTIPFSSLSDNPGLCGSSVNRSCSSVLPKPLVLYPNSSSHRNPHSEPVFTSSNTRHRKIILSISAIIAIGAAVFIALGVIAISVLNIHARSYSGSTSAVPLALSEVYYSSQSSAITNANANANADSGKLVMFSGDSPEFPSNSHAILNKGSELGRGGFGTVYKASLRDGRRIAIKKLSVSSLVKSQEEFEREIKKLGKIRHPNLVSLQGYYWTNSLQLLISEFVPCGSLHRALHDSSTEKFLTWEERFNIVLGSARSLSHLHRHNVIHYNLKSNNVLIDSYGEAKIGDYGLARLLPTLDRYVLSSKIQSALGYMAPEFTCRTVKITEKCDVYGFGVLTLEAVTGRRPVEYMEDDVVVLCDVVRGLVEEGRIEECVDQKLRGRFMVEEVAAVVKLGLICTSQVPSNRPEMREVVKILEMIRCPDQDEMSSG